MQNILNFSLKLIRSHGPPGLSHSSSKKIHELFHGVKGIAVLTGLYPQGGQTAINNTHQQGKKQGLGKEPIRLHLSWMAFGEDMDSFEIWVRSCWQQLVSVNPFCIKLQWWRVGASPGIAPIPSLGRSVLELMHPHSSNSSGGASSCV